MLCVGRYILFRHSRSSALCSRLPIELTELDTGQVLSYHSDPPLAPNGQTDACLVQLKPVVESVRVHRSRIVSISFVVRQRKCVGKLRRTTDPSLGPCPFAFCSRLHHKAINISNHVAATDGLCLSLTRTLICESVGGGRSWSLVLA